MLDFCSYFMSKVVIEVFAFTGFKTTVTIWVSPKF